MRAKSISTLGSLVRGTVEETLNKLLIPGRTGQEFTRGRIEKAPIGRWTESVAVGSETFVTATKETLGDKGEGREVIGGDGSYELRESPAVYEGILGHGNAVLRLQNECFWRNADIKSM